MKWCEKISIRVLPQHLPSKCLRAITANRETEFKHTKFFLLKLTHSSISMNTLKRAAITAVAHYVPDDVYTNKWFEDKIETNDEWIRSRTGIIERRFAPREMATSDMIVRASENMFATFSIDKATIDCVIVATVTPDYVFPSTAAVVQNALGLKAWGFDLAAACSGFVFALETARRMVESGGAQRVLVCGADKMSTIINFEDRATCVLFGDGAGVALVEAINDSTVGILDSVVGMDGSGCDSLRMEAGGSRNPATHETVEKKMHYAYQDGKTVFKSAVVQMADAAYQVMSRNNLTGDDVRWLVPHQANLRIIDATADRMGLSSDKVMINIEKYGNTTAGTIPICLSEWHSKGELVYGDTVVLACFGGGYTWGSMLIKWAIK